MKKQNVNIPQSNYSKPYFFNAEREEDNYNSALKDISITCRQVFFKAISLLHHPVLKESRTYGLLLFSVKAFLYHVKIESR